MSSPGTPPVVLFKSATSPVGRRLEWYLSLRGIPFVLCEVDGKMPRPVLADLGLKYRRIPVLAVGRDIYCDSRCIIKTLEEQYPSHTPRLGADPNSQPFLYASEKVLEIWALENLFAKTTGVMPFDGFLARGPEWIEDRRQLTGSTFTKEAAEQRLPDALAGTRINLNLMEMFLVDGREWMAGQKPGLADVHTAWVFDWLLRGDEFSAKHAYPELINDTRYPKLMAWLERLNVLIAEKKNHAETQRLTASQTVKLIEAAEFWEDEQLDMTEWDPTSFERGTVVDLYTTDVPSGFQNRDTGELVGMTADRVTIRGTTEEGVNVRIHYPRTNVKIAKASGTP